MMKQVLNFAANTYGFDLGTLSFLSDSTNKIYAFQRDNKGYILRITQKPVKYLTDTKAEIEWLYYLFQKGISVSLPLFTLQKDLVTSFMDDSGQSYILSAYEKAEGIFWNKNDPMLWNKDIFYNWGRVMGEMHQLTKAFLPSDTECRRQEFKGDFALDDSYKFHPDVKQAAEEIIRDILLLPRDKASYGLIHCDLHPWNFLIDGKTIRVFDFDDCLYGWFAMDIAIALYHGLWWGRPSLPEAAQAFSEEFITAFLKGYADKNALESYWYTKIPLFMRYRQICKFSWFFNPQDVNEEQINRISNIKNGRLFDDFDLKPGNHDIITETY